ncbi:hypothetical protein HBB16_02455 [Pseudonocardia sp. MCCB 268]|nr:hypothetical protein [Pseudonocardia cytotoxica]
MPVLVALVLSVVAVAVGGAAGAAPGPAHPLVTWRVPGTRRRTAPG